MIVLRCAGMKVGSIALNVIWTEGLVIWRESFHLNEEMTKENLDGEVYWP